MEQTSKSLIDIFEDISYTFGNGVHYCINFDKINSAFTEEEIKNLNRTELLALYLQRKGIDNIAQAIREFCGLN